MLFNNLEEEDYHNITADDDSQFMKFLNQIIEKRIRRDSLPFTSFKITAIEFETAIARLYNDQSVEWGKVDSTFFSENGEETKQEFWFTVE